MHPALSYVQRKKKDNTLHLRPANLPFEEESKWLDRLFDDFLQDKISLDDLKRGVVLVFLSFSKKARRQARKRAKMELEEKVEPRETAPIPEKTVAVVDDMLTPKLTCPACGKNTLRVRAPYEVWLSCSTCGYKEEHEPGTEEWKKYVDVVLGHQFALVAQAGSY
ncbi:hypothetical protein B9Q03_14720 [Candidatus Marsarchaeota G2 archaeon OSP_D]|uniref:Uncharacterized protein n=1 Tax=Candidatus Marsarchaeota G2 archaeon OSP_D TaxID=1978157 RepID=A0A2R6A6J4_9ARCH|nr:MAG: hypothetical protein B9Q03_14720 [Candidatus Marsarchaeota G2 archaeon OSP_D]